MTFRPLPIFGVICLISVGWVFANCNNHDYQVFDVDNPNRPAECKTCLCGCSPPDPCPGGPAVSTRKTAISMFKCAGGAPGTHCERAEWKPKQMCALRMGYDGPCNGDEPGGDPIVTCWQPVYYDDFEEHPCGGC